MNVYQFKDMEKYVVNGSKNTINHHDYVIEFYSARIPLAGGLWLSVIRDRNNKELSFGTFESYNEAKINGLRYIDSLYVYKACA